MASVNKVILLGHCGRDPELRYMPSGGAVASISIATSSKRKDKATGDMIEDTQWHRVTFYERLAEIVGEWVKKGALIYIEGRIKYGKYTDKDGIERSSVDIIATELQLLGNKQSGDAPQAGSSQRRSAAPSAAPRPAAPAPKPANAGTGFDDMDDDIPF
jgi:single-strand DNA-binding protein